MAETGKSYYESLYQVTTAMTSARNPEDVLLTIVENMTQCMGAKGCALMLLTWDRKLLLHTVCCGLSDSYIKKGPLTVDESIRKALEGKPVVVLDVTEDERIQYPEAARKEGIKSMLTVPITLREENIGILRVYASEPRQFSEDDIYFVRSVAYLGAIALENTKRYERLQEEYETFRRRTF